MFNLLSIMGNPKPYSGFYVQDVSGQANSIYLKKSNVNAPTLTIETSSDGKAWTVLGQTSTTALTISIPANKRVYIRSNATSWGNTSGFGFNTFFYSIYNCKVGGNIMSLLYGSNYTGNETSFPSGSTYNFYRLFDSNAWLTDVSDLILPATTLTNYCYYQMFYGCASLTQAPALPATTLAQNCYGDMFSGCTSLTSAPTLPATTLERFCYASMFYGCTSLTSAPALPATTLAQNCYASMFSGCTSLTTAPALPTTTLAQKCYQRMFQGCTSLNSVTCLATDISASNCTNNWLASVSATGTFTKAASMSSWTTGANGIPSGWTVQDAQ